MNGPTRRVPLVIIVLLVMGVAQHPFSARAQTNELPAVDLTWEADSPCPREAGVRAEIARILGTSDRPRKHVVARAIVRRIAASRWRAELSVRTEETSANRSFEADTCNAIASATALIVALAVDERATRPSTPATFEEPPATPSAGASTSPPLAEAALPRTSEGAPKSLPPKDASSSATPVADARRITAALPSVGFTLHGVAALSAAVDRGTLPSTGFGAELAGALLLARGSWNARIEVAAAYWLSESSTVSGRPSEGGSFSLLTFATRACAEANLGRVNVGPCLGAEIDRMSASSFGTNVPIDGSAAWGSISGGGALAIRLTSLFFLRLRAEALVPLARPRFVVEEPALGTTLEVHRAAVAAGRATLGLELRFF